MSPLEATKALRAYLRKATEAEALAFIEALCKGRPELRKALIDALREQGE